MTASGNLPSQQLYDLLPGAHTIITPDLIDIRLVDQLVRFMNKENRIHAISGLGLLSLRTTAVLHPFQDSYGGRELEHTIQTDPRLARISTGLDEEYSWGDYCPRDGYREKSATNRVPATLGTLAKRLNPTVRASTVEYFDENSINVKGQRVDEFIEAIKGLPSVNEMASLRLNEFVVNRLKLGLSLTGHNPRQISK